MGVANMARSRRVPPLTNEVRRALVHFRVRAVLHGEDPHEGFMALFFLAQGLLFAAPADTTAHAPALRLVRDLGGDWVIVALFFPVGLLLLGCALRPLIASVRVHRNTLYAAVAISCFMTVLSWASLPWSSPSVTYLLLAYLAVMSFLNLDRI